MYLLASIVRGLLFTALLVSHGNLLLLAHASMEITHRCLHFLQKLILILLRYLIHLSIFMYSLPCYLVDDVFALRYALKDLLVEIAAAEWAL